MLTEKRITASDVAALDRFGVQSSFLLMDLILIEGKVRALVSLLCFAVFEMQVVGVQEVL